MTDLTGRMATWFRVAIFFLKAARLIRFETDLRGGTRNGIVGEAIHSARFFREVSLRASFTTPSDLATDLNVCLH